MDGLGIFTRALLTGFIAGIAMILCVLGWLGFIYALEEWFYFAPNEAMALGLALLGASVVALYIATRRAEERHLRWLRERGER